MGTDPVSSLSPPSDTNNPSTQVLMSHYVYNCGYIVNDIRFIMVKCMKCVTRNVVLDSLCE